MHIGQEIWHLNYAWTSAASINYRTRTQLREELRIVRRSRREQPNKVIGQLQILNCPHNHAKKAKLLACLLFFSLSLFQKLVLYKFTKQITVDNFWILIFSFWKKIRLKLVHICIFNQSFNRSNWESYLSRWNTKFCLSKDLLKIGRNSYYPILKNIISNSKNIACHAKLYLQNKQKWFVFILTTSRSHTMLSPSKDFSYTLFIVWIWCWIFYFTLFNKRQP